MSIIDALTDINAKPVQFGDPSKLLHAHRGIYESAIIIIIQTQLEQSGPEEPGDYTKRVDSNADYQPVIVGHSLDAGAASTLSL